MNDEHFRVLIIDDEQFHAEAVAESLERVGYDCVVATSGSAGARRIEQEDFDVILTDLRMADMDGLAILRKARQDLPEAEVVLMTGTGKELAAKAIHTNSPRKNKPFVAMNCTALNENLLEDELFGHESGAFTGADRVRKGRFEHANNGTLFLDEVGDMPMTLQSKLLRVLENQEVFRIGSNDPIKVNVRLL